MHRSRTLGQVAALAAIVALSPGHATAQLEIITGKGLNALAVPTNCFNVTEQHAWEGRLRPILLDDTWTTPVVAFASNPGEIWLMTNTIPDYVNLTSSNPAILGVPSTVLLKTEEAYNHQTNSQYTLTDIATRPTPVTITAASTRNRGFRLSEELLVYPQFHIDSIFFSRQQATYADRRRVTITVRLPWALPSYMEAFQAVLHKPTFTWGGERYAMEAPEWGGNDTLVVAQADGQRDLSQTFTLSVKAPPFGTPVDRIRWRRTRDIEFSMAIELKDRSPRCELVEEDATRTFRFKVRNPSYRAR